MSSPRDTNNPSPSASAPERSLDLCFSALRHLKFKIGPSKLYLDDSDLNKLKIECGNLDLRTGEPADGGEQFFKLPPLQTVEEIAKSHELHEYDGLGGPDPIRLSNFHESRFVWILLQKHLELNEEAVLCEERGQSLQVPDLLQRSGWCLRG